MNSLQSLFNLKTAGILGLCSTFLVGIPLMAEKANAQAQQRVITSPLCPGLYYQEPWESVLYPPVGCPPNERVLYQDAAGNYAPFENTTPVQPQSPPLPEERSEPIANIMPTQGTANVMLNNSTNAMITYEVIGHTQQRRLSPGEEADLTNLPLPVTITVVREDKGLLQVIPLSSDSEMLRLTLEEDPTFDDTQGVIRIQEDGQVFLN
ncbi:conserved hypothetical protein [Gloeothece citriformis PCC 7424]|uniref:Uncharacterized protein n=1 Tax=Gloeothece citriformis (strain PCC 7424) TaxID=65393 RepID=B7KDS3_GLOC7|nr:hypothetical protein [Gloeothece citriformis]ACK70375.1 conserved hypothetical protein [Gloeothece citriformis PCC 7424]